ncbi:MAG: FmdB family zinc ribbon protein [Gemmatimonadota bacterium]
MPTYEYVCDACGHRFERFQKISDPAVRTCPECRKRKVRRLISRGGGLVFRGPGFYATDYRKAPPPSEESPKKSDTEKAAKPAADAGGGGDTEE